jgi:hypothetical protein
MCADLRHSAKRAKVLATALTAAVGTARKRATFTRSAGARLVRSNMKWGVNTKKESG